MTLVPGLISTFSNKGTKGLKISKKSLLVLILILANWPTTKKLKILSKSVSTGFNHPYFIKKNFMEVSDTNGGGFQYLIFTLH